MPATAPKRPEAGRPQAVRVETDQPFRWTRERYDQAVEAGVLTPDDKVELLDGEVVAKMPQNNPHQVATGLVSAALRAAFGPGVHTRDEKAVALSDLSKPEPEVAVVRGQRRDYLDHAPTPDAILLLVEVADSSILRDRIRKAALYAEAGVPEYWIVNLVDRTLEIHRDPVGGVYRTKTTLTPEETVVPTGAPEASIAVIDLLP